MDPYGAQIVYDTFQNLKMEEDEKKFTPEEITKSFIKFIKEYQLGHIYKYR
jgi:hypothetical protein